MAKSTATALFEQGDAAFKLGQWRESLSCFAGVAEVAPLHFKTRFRIADCLLNLGHRAEALEVYKAIAWHSIKAGYPLLGLVAIKMILLLDPAYEDVLMILAELYSSDSDRVDRHIDGPAVPALPNKTVEPVPADDKLVGVAVDRAMEAQRVTEFPDVLPPIPLFSYLDEDAFVRVLDKLKLRRYSSEELIIRQGERGDSFFILADGDVWVKKDLEEDGGVTLAHLHRRAVFGEMALISDEPRQAAVVAGGDADVLELRRSDLVVMAAQMRSVTDALKSFTRERFLGNLTATHPFFAPLNREERHVAMERFTPVTFDDGDALIQEGEPSPGLYLLLAGQAMVSKNTPQDRVHLATLRASDLCGEMSLLNSGAATHATVRADGKVEALFLSREGFGQVVDEHPELIKFLAGLSEERLRQNRAVLQQKGLLEDDEHVMI